MICPITPHAQAAWKSALAMLALIAAGPGKDCRADVINFTGNVANDFTTANTSTVIQGTPGSVAQASYITQNGWTTGFLVDTVRFSYDAKTDTMYVGVQAAPGSIVGDADGNPNNNTSPQMAAAGGANLPNFGGDKSLTLAFANETPSGGVGSTAFVAGIPADKSQGNPGNINDFTVSTYSPSSGGLAYSYGTILNNHVGELAVGPSAGSPDFEFAITNFTKITGFDPANGFYVGLFEGSQKAIVVGKESLPWSKVAGTSASPGGITDVGTPVIPPAPTHAIGPTNPTPEPASVVLFVTGAVAALAATRRRKSA